MKERLASWGVAGALIALALLFLLHLAIAAAGSPDFRSLILAMSAAAAEKDIPAWVQAVGSIGAILAAIEVARRQAMHNRQLQRELANDQAARSLGSVGALADMAIQEFSEAETAVRSLQLDASKWLVEIYTESFYKEFWKMIDAVPVHTLPTYESVAHVIRFKDIIACMEFNLHQLYLNHHPPLLATETTRLNHLQDNLRQMKDELSGFNEHLRKYGLVVQGRSSYLLHISFGSKGRR